MNAHAYHHACGCSACCATEEADERADELEQLRDDAIAARVPALIAERKRDEDACWGALADLGDDDRRHLLENVGRFFARFERAPTDADMAMAGAELWRDLRPLIEAGLRDEAEADAGKEYDAPKPAWPRSRAA